MSMLIMPTEIPTTTTDGHPSPQVGLTPKWAMYFYRRRKSIKNAEKAGESSTGNPDLLTPDSRSRSSGSRDSSIRSNRSRGRRSFKEMVNRLRSSSNVTLVNELPLKESDFREIYDWYTGFQRYNQLVTTQLSPTSSETSDMAKFDQISNILSKNCGGRFIHGLPEAVFDMALLWCPAEPIKRKESSTEPSWSWTGWSGAVNFSFDHISCPDLISIPKGEGELMRSEILHYYVGPHHGPYSIRREKKEPRLRTHYPPYFFAPRGHDSSANSDTLRFSASTISAEGFSTEQLRYDGDNKMIPCSQLLIGENKQCGVIMDYEELISEPSASGPYEFVLVSRTRRCEPAIHTRRPTVPTVHPSGTPIWDGTRFIWDREVIDFDEELFEPGPWKMLNVLLIRWVGEHAERVAVARIHEDAWLQCSPGKKDIILR
jgi:hypothetical protein